MLGPMDIPWLVLGVVVGVGLVLLAGLVAALVLRRRRDRASGVETSPRDDLPGFLEFPPGSTTAPPATGWAALAAPPPPPSPPRGRRDTLVVVGAMAGT